MSDISKPLDFNVGSVQCLAHHGSKLLSGRYDFDFNVYLPTREMNLQRELVWTDHQKSEFIKSIIKGIKIPPFCLIENTHEDGTSYYEVIDGKQRLSTYISFIKGEFNIMNNGIEYSIDGLDSKTCNRVEQWGIHAHIAFSDPENRITDDQKIAWFRLINYTSTPQEDIHLQNLEKQ